MCDLPFFSPEKREGRLMDTLVPSWLQEVRARPRFDPSTLRSQIADRMAAGPDPQGFAQKVASPLGQRLRQFGGV